MRNPTWEIGLKLSSVTNPYIKVETVLKLTILKRWGVELHPKYMEYKSLNPYCSWGYRAGVGVRTFLKGNYRENKDRMRAEELCQRTDRSSRGIFYIIHFVCQHRRQVVIGIGVLGKPWHSGAVSTYSSDCAPGRHWWLLQRLLLLFLFVVSSE